MRLPLKARADLPGQGITSNRWDWLLQVQATKLRDSVRNQRSSPTISSPYEAEVRQEFPFLYDAEIESGQPKNHNESVNKRYREKAGPCRHRIAGILHHGYKRDSVERNS
jgi:hypothetical protein